MMSHPQRPDPIQPPNKSLSADADCVSPDMDTRVAELADRFAPGDPSCLGWVGWTVLILLVIAAILLLA